MRRIFFDERFERRDAQVQILIGRRIGNAVGQRQIVSRLGDPLRRRIGVRGEQVLPGAAGVLRFRLRQLHFAQPEAGLDFGRVVGMILDELGIPLGRFGQLIQKLIAASHLQLDLDPPSPGRHVGQCLEIEVERLLVVGLMLHVVFRLEIAVGEFQINLGQLILASRRQQVVDFRAIDHLGGMKFALAGQGNRLAEPSPACPTAIGKCFGEPIELGDGRVVLPGEIESPALEIGEIILRGILGIGRGVDGFDGRQVIMVLQRLAHGLGHLRQRQKLDIGRWHRGGFCIL